MSNRKKQLAVGLIVVAGLLATFGALSLSFARHASAADDPVADKETHKADRAQLKAQMEQFLKAFESGDAERVASFWTVNGELIDDDGTVYRGRTAIAKAYREIFKTKAKRRAEIQRDSLRFPSHDTAIDEGYFTVRVGKAEPTRSRYSVLHVREGGKWQMALVREWPSANASLRDLEWLIGTWVAKRANTEVQTTYKWLWKKSFIRVDFKIHQKDRTLSGFQMIGTDPASGELRSWTFESEGGFGDATWSRDGQKWVLEAAGRLTDGTTMTATNILLPLDNDSFTWQSVRRSVNGEEVDDLPPIKVTRVKPQK